MKHFRTSLLLIAAATTAVAAGCIHVKVDPIYAKIDLNVKIDRSLDDFYSFQSPTTAPAVPVPTPTTIESTPSK